MANSLHQRIKTHVLPDVSESAKIAVNLDFNPSGVKQVDVLKMLAAALITECEKVRDAADGPVQARRAAVAITAHRGQPRCGRSRPLPRRATRKR